MKPLVSSASRLWNPILQHIVLLPVNHSCIGAYPPSNISLILSTTSPSHQHVLLLHYFSHQPSIRLSCSINQGIFSSLHALSPSHPPPIIPSLPSYFPPSIHVLHPSMYPSSISHLTHPSFPSCHFLPGSQRHSWFDESEIISRRSAGSGGRSLRTVQTSENQFSR